MTTHNAEIAAAFYRLAELLEIEGANPFRVRAYRNAAQTIETLPESVAAMLAHGEDLAELPGIGKDLAGKIAELVETGHLSALEAEAKRLPGSLVELAALPGLGPKRIKLLYDKLRVTNIDQLAKAVDAGNLAELPSLGAKLEEKLRDVLAKRVATPQRIKLSTAGEIGKALLAYLEAVPGVEAVAIAGSYRRRRETVGDLDIVAAARRSGEVMARFVAYPEVDQIVEKGSTRSTVRLRSGLQVDLRVVPPASYGAALLYFTGSKAHSIKLRGMAIKRGLKLNEYGVFKGEARIPARNEAAIYRLLDLPYIEPELREDHGEIEAARRGALPRLLSLADIRGDLHTHTNATDGHNTIAEMAEAAKARGYAYLAISDHTRHVTVAHGLDPRRLARQIAAIDRLNERFRDFRILKSAEVDILEDGSLDLPDSILEALDFTVCAVHWKLDLPSARQTERILRAMDNPHFNILAHPSGRLIGERAPSALDMERILRGAKEHGCFVEINGQPERLDLDDTHARMAKELGVKLAVSTDAHSAVTLEFMRHGVDQARRAWLEPSDVLNTRPWSELSGLLKRR